MPRIETRKCGACGHKFDLLVTKKDGIEEFSALDHPGGLDRLGCPKCEGEGEKVIGMATGIELGGEAGVGKVYPYFDRALGVRVESAQHRRWLMKHYPDGRPREQRLWSADGWDPDADVAKDRAEAEADALAYQELVDASRRQNPEAHAKLEAGLAMELATQEEDTDLDKLMLGTGY